MVYSSHCAIGIYDWNVWCWDCTYFQHRYGVTYRFLLELFKQNRVTWECSDTIGACGMWLVLLFFVWSLFLMLLCWYLIAVSMCTRGSQETWQLHSLKLLMHGDAFHAGMSLHLRCLTFHVILQTVFWYTLKMNVNIRQSNLACILT